MNDFVQSQAIISDLTLSGFAHRLESELQTRMLPREKDSGSMVHIAGYVKEGDTYHPEFWFISNVHAIDRKTGEYGGIDHNFKLSEDFWTRDCPEKKFDEAFPRICRRVPDLREWICPWTYMLCLPSTCYE